MARTIEPEKEITPRMPITRREVVLVVDDDEQVLRLVKRVLERAGFECVAVGDGRAAHNAAVESRPDIILLDLMLGETTGDQQSDKKDNYPRPSASVCPHPDPPHQ